MARLLHRINKEFIKYNSSKFFPFEIIIEEKLVEMWSSTNQRDDPPHKYHASFLA